MATITEGFTYVPDSDSGLFAEAKAGAIVRNPDRAPPWIVVHHAIESICVANWPGRLWRASVLDTTGIEQASASAPYTRAIAVKILDELPASRLFGKHGDSVVAVMEFAAKVDSLMAERMAEVRHPDAGQAYSRAWQRWLVEEKKSSGSPINCGLTVLYDLIWKRAEVITGPTAFIEDDEGERELGPVWSGVLNVLLDAALALGAPSLVREDVGVLTAAWRTVRKPNIDLPPGK